MPVVVYILRGKAQFSYHVSTIEALLGRGLTVHVFFDAASDAESPLDLTAFDRWAVAHPDVRHGYFPRRSDLLRKPLMFFRELRAFGSYCARPDAFEFYRTRWSRQLHLPEVLRRGLVSRAGRALAGSSLVRNMTEAIERHSPAAANLIDWLHREKPSAIVASPANLRLSSEIEIVKAARTLGIMTVIPVASWDNTSTKGLFYIQPDLLLAWNEEHQHDAIHYHHLDHGSIRITGAPFFDKWRCPPRPAAPREEVCAAVGLRPGRPFVLYLGSSANIAKDETWFVRELNTALTAHRDPRVREMQILFRPHPANWEPAQSLPETEFAVWPRQGALPDNEERFADFLNCLHHSACVVGINTSGMLDAIIYGKPVVSPIIDRYRLTQDLTPHFQHIRDAGAIYLANDAAAVADRIAEIMAGDDPAAKNRQAFVKRFIWPRDKSGGDAQADEIVALIAGVRR